ncbi:MAG: ABC transporter ATP-binding protein [Chloroflexi bacterium]|nr:ABC transporter ATP-binding protein [Chloroflexota bacterium]
MSTRQSTAWGGSSGAGTAAGPGGSGSRGPRSNGRGRRERPDFAALGRAIRYLGHYRRLAVTAYFLLLMSGAAQLGVPQLVQNIIDAVTQGDTAQRIAALPAAAPSAALVSLGGTPDQVARSSSGAERVLVTSGWLILALAIARGCFAFSQSYTSERVSQSVAFDFRNELYAQVQRLSFSYHDRTQTGQLMVRATDDVEKVRLFIGQGLLLAVQALVILVATLLVLAFTNLRLTLVVLPILPIALVVFMVFGSVAHPLFMQIQIRVSRLNTILQENLAGIRVVKAFVREPVEQARFAAAADDLMAQQIHVARTLSFLFPTAFLMGSLGQAAVFYFGGRQIIGGTLSLGEWQKFSLYLVYIFFPLGQLGFIISQMAQAGASASRIFEILDAQSDVTDGPGATDLPPVQGRVELDHVTLRYFGSGDPVLRDVSFAVEPGQTVALLGATGSGKSSIINLIPRFYDPTAGRVLIDGHDVKTVRLDSLRSQIGIVLQDTTLFSGTIRENIAFGRPEATQAEIEAAAKAAAAHEYIMRFPQGYDTPVGERGTTLSGGQKQRLAIARTLLLDPRILILDDSTSSVDAVTEYHIQQALDRLMEGRTSFVIAQRISTARNAALIVILDRGEIVAMGKHEELMEQSPIYAEIHSSQLVGDTEKAGVSRSGFLVPSSA